MIARGLLIVVLAGAARGAAGETLTLGIDDAVARAVEASPRLARFRSLEAAADAELRAARAGRLPEVELQASYTRNSDVPELSIPQPVGPPQVIFPNIPNNYGTRLGLALPLSAGGRISGRIAAGEDGRAAAEHDRRAALGDLVLEVKTAYWRLVTAREAAAVLGEAIKAFEAHLADSRNRERFGMVARNDVLAVQVERDGAELDRLRAESAAQVGEADLRRLLDLPPGTGVEPTEPLDEALPTDEDLEALVVEALAARAERSSLASRARAADAQADVERGARLPQVSLGAGYDLARPNREILPPSDEWNDTWDVGVRLSWSVFDGGRRSAGEARARAQAEAVRHQLAELDRAIRLEVTQQLLERRTAGRGVEVAARALEAARENRRVSADRYREGVIASFELLDAEVALERAALDRTEALASLRLAGARLDRAIGR